MDRKECEAYDAIAESSGNAVNPFLIQGTSGAQYVISTTHDFILSRIHTGAY